MDRYYVQMRDKSGWIDVPAEVFERRLGVGISNPWSTQELAELAAEQLEMTDINDHYPDDGNGWYQVVERNQEEKNRA